MPSSVNTDNIENEDPSQVVDIYQTTQPSAEANNVLTAFRYRTFKCPRCGTEFSVTRLEVGKTLICPDCETKVVVPNNLDFDTETEYERQFFNSTKLRRDELLSPLRNPNRIGVDLTGDNLYGLEGESERSPNKETYYPVRCRVCETLMQAPSSMLEHEIICPDCGTKTIVTTSFKTQQAGTDVKFEPIDRGTYELGEIPEIPNIVVQKTNGTMVTVGRNDETISPERVLNDAFLKAERQKKRKNTEQTPIPPTVEQFEARLRQESSQNFIGGWLARQAKRRQIKDSSTDEDDLSQFLPKQVLKKRDGQQVWTFPSPPQPAPLFNKTFRVIFTQEIWARGGILAIVFCVIAYIVNYWLLNGLKMASMGRGTMTGVIGDAESLISWGILIPLGLVASTLTGLFFWSVYNAGNSGAYKVVEWRKEDLLGFFGFGIWFAILVGVSFLPSAVLLSFENWNIDSIKNGETSTIGRLVSSGILWGGFWIFFPVFWISTLQNDWPFCPINMNVLSSFISKFADWAQFYCATVVWFFIPTVLWGITSNGKLFWFLAPLLLLYCAIFYGLLLGRLSWILDDEIRSQDFDD